MINKKAQQAVGMSFGMIFAIFLIIVFVVFAFIAAKTFLDWGDKVGVGLFYEELQEAVDNAVRGQESDSRFAINLPSGVKQVCFANLSASITNPGPEYDAIRNYDVYIANVFLVPPEKGEGMEWKMIDRLNISKITAEGNPYCVDADGDLKIVKSFYDRLVFIE